MSDHPQKRKEQPAPMPGGPAGKPVQVSRRRQQAPPQQAPRQQTQGEPPMQPSFQSEEDLDYQRTTQEAYIPEPPTQQQALGNRISDTRKQQQDHPLLQQLKTDLGITHHVPEDLEIGGHLWSMVPVNKQLFGVASRIVDELAIGDLEKLSMLEIAIASVAIVAIDGTPTYDVFGVAPQDVIRDPMNPPSNIRVRAASALFDFLNIEAKYELSSKLHSAYVDTWDKHGTVKSYLDEKEGAAWTWMCGEEGCSELVKEPPRYSDDNNEKLLPMYCKYHGTRMVAISQGEEDESPLP